MHEVGPKRPRILRKCAIAALVAVLPPLIAALVLSKAYWGYFFNRPPPDSTVLSARQVLGISALAEADRPNPYIGFARGARGSIIDRIDDAHREGGYYNLEQRALMTLANKGIDWLHVPELSDAQITELNAAVERSGEIDFGTTGYTRATALRGYAMHFFDARNHPMFFVAARGWQARNDHYPYYEFVFRRSDSDGGLILQSSTCFYYDVAGIEHVEWYAFVLLFGSMWAPPVLLIASVWILIGWFRHWKRKKTGCCRSCGYPIGSSAVCTECGSRVAE
jgi:hypothetical protein